MLFSMSAKLRVVFAGTPQNAASTLESLVTQGVNIVGVLTRNDASVGRTKKQTPSPVAAKADQLGIEVFKTNIIDDLAFAWLEALGADIGAVVAYGTIFKQPVLDAPRLGWLNLHYSLLPELPGPAPVQHAIMQGKKSTGVTVFRLDTGIDTGPIVASAKSDIEETDTAFELLAKLTEIGAELLAEVLLDNEAKLSLAKQQSRDQEHPTASKPTRGLAKLDFSSDASTQLNKIRAMNPEPMAWFQFNETSIRVIRARSSKSSAGEAEAIVVDKELVFGFKEGALVFELVQPAGKAQMSGADWFRGLRVEKMKLI
jgi:methionyl-tRNA formyltransferase